MALPRINPAAIGETIARTAGAKVAQKVAQSMSPKMVRDVQRILSIGSWIGNGLDLKTGISILDSVLALSSQSRDQPSPLLGGLTLRQAQAIHEQQRAARVAMKNLFFVTITDSAPPSGALGSALTSAFSSVIGPSAGAVSRGLSGSIGAAAGSAVTSALNRLGLGDYIDNGNNIGQIAMSSFDLLAVDVSYGINIISDHVQAGSSFMDVPTGREPTELQIITMDDEAGSLKRWFDGKLEQMAHSDGTVGLPAEYLVNIEVVQAIPSELVEGAHLAYRKAMRLRPQSINIENSRRDQAVQELQMSFTQFDGFMGI